MAKSERLTRVELIHMEMGGTRWGTGKVERMNVLVDTHPLLLIGNRVTLKSSDDPTKEWTILNVHETLNRADINYGWNNNI